MSKSDDKNLGCLGCLGSLAVFTFIVSIFFGSGTLMRFVRCQLSDLGDKQKIVAEAVQKFHTQLDQRKFKEIYEQSIEIIKNKQNQEKIVSYCTAIQREFESVKLTDQVNW
jgi:hypothetical protein